MSTYLMLYFHIHRLGIPQTFYFDFAFIYESPGLINKKVVVAQACWLSRLWNMGLTSHYLANLTDPPHCFPYFIVSLASVLSLCHLRKV